jgi:hypothetical protein
MFQEEITITLDNVCKVRSRLSQDALTPIFIFLIPSPPPSPTGGEGKGEKGGSFLLDCVESLE